MTVKQKSDNELTDSPKVADSQPAVTYNFNQQDNYNFLVASEGLQSLQAINYLPKEHQRKAMVMAEKDQAARLSRMDKELEASIVLANQQEQNAHELNMKRFDATAKSEAKVQVFSLIVLTAILAVFATAVILWLLRDNNAAWYICGGSAVLTAIVAIFKYRMQRK